MASYSDNDPPRPGATTLRDDEESSRRYPSSSNSMHNEGRTQRPRGSSNTSRDQTEPKFSQYQQAQQPINDAVTSAFNNSDATSSAGVSPELLQQITAQITANVLQQLKGTDWPSPLSQPQMSGSHMDANSSAGGSPPPGRATVYTPPSPYRTSEDSGTAQPSPHFPPTQSSVRATSPSREKRASSPSSQACHPSEAETNVELPTRPKGPKRISTAGEVTTLERVWGTLFDEQGQTTERLGQFLRGVATHLIEDYEPKNSLVVTPAKLQKYYEETKLANELYPWKIVFDDRTSSISRMFREIGAQHHLVQEKVTDRPDIPGLTPHGFETWVTLLLKAHPDQEFERLAKTALDMPISNPENRRERFPKELSRRLFPVHADHEIATRLQKALSTHCNVNFPVSQSSTAGPNPRAGQTNQPLEEPGQKAAPPRSSQEEKGPPGNSAAQTSSASSQPGPSHPRQPQPEVASDGGKAVTDDNPAERRPPPPIERERQPYIAAPGAGKSYDIGDKLPTGGEFKAPAPPLHEVRPGRSNSVHARSRPSDNSKPGPPPVSIHQRPAPPPPLDVPSESRHHRSNSTYHRDQPRPGRNRSPSVAKDTGNSAYMRRSEADISYTPSSSHHPYNGGDPYDDARRHREYEAHRERLANDRYDAARMAAYDPRERERDRESRPRMGSVSAFDGPQSARGAPPSYSASAVSADEDYYRDRGPSSAGSYNTSGSISTGFQPPPSVAREPAYGAYPPTGSYPPSSYRDVR